MAARTGRIALPPERAMTIKSMTGFARADGATRARRWHWELRSVNGRGLDVRLRLPPGFEALEPKVREAVAAALHARQRQRHPDRAARAGAQPRSASTRRRCAQVLRGRRARARS